MPHDPTPAQQAASRANGARSSGPSSAAGKARAARNATRHGVLGTVLRLDPAERPVLDGLLEDLTARLAPQGVAEHALVEELALLAIRRRRLDRLELLTLAALEEGGLDAGAPGLVSLATLIRYRARLAAEERRIHATLEDHRRRRLELQRAFARQEAARATGQPTAGAAGAATRAAAERCPDMPAPAGTNEPEPPPASAAAAAPAPPNRALRRRLAALRRRGRLPAAA
jgi:hypothetical protein